MDLVIKCLNHKPESKMYWSYALSLPICPECGARNRLFSLETMVKSGLTTEQIKEVVKALQE